MKSYMIQVSQNYAIVESSCVYILDGWKCSSCGRFVGLRQNERDECVSLELSMGVWICGVYREMFTIR